MQIRLTERRLWVAAVVAAVVSTIVAAVVAAIVATVVAIVGTAVVAIVSTTVVAIVSTAVVAIVSTTVVAAIVAAVVPAITRTAVVSTTIVGTAITAITRVSLHPTNWSPTVIQRRHRCKVRGLGEDTVEGVGLRTGVVWSSTGGLASGVAALGDGAVVGAAATLELAADGVGDGRNGRGGTTGESA